MPWKETDVMTEKERFVTLARTGRFTITDLCVDFEKGETGSVHEFLIFLRVGEKPKRRGLDSMTVT